MIFEKKSVFVAQVELLGHLQEVALEQRRAVMSVGMPAGHFTYTGEVIYVTTGQLQLPGGVLQFPVAVEGAVSIEEAFEKFPAAFVAAKERAEAELRQRALMTAVPPGGRINGRDLRG